MWFDVQRSDLGKALAKAENDIERAVTSGMRDAVGGKFQLKQPFTHRSRKGREWVDWRRINQLRSTAAIALCHPKAALQLSTQLRSFRER
jgi:hypothetical protein